MSYVGRETYHFASSRKENLCFPMENHYYGLLQGRTPWGGIASEGREGVTRPEAGYIYTCIPLRGCLLEHSKSRHRTASAPAPFAWVFSAASDCWPDAGARKPVKASNGKTQEQDI